MIREKVGVIKEEEKNEIMNLYMKKIALEELLPSLSSQSISLDEKEYLYEKMIKDLGNAKLSAEMWWRDIAERYNWKSVNKGHWYIDFKTNEIYLDVYENAVE